MSQTSKSFAQKLGGMVAEVKQKAQIVDSSLTEAGVRVDSDRTLATRIERLYELTTFLNDDSIDIEDKVKAIDMILTTVGLAWGRGASSRAWSIIWDAWQNLLAWWVAILSVRRSYVMQTVSIDELVELAPKDAKDKPSTMMIPRTVKPATAIREYLNKPGKITIRDMTEEPLVHQKDDDPAYNEQEVEEFVREIGEIWIIRRGLKVLNYAFQEADVTTKSVMVFHNSVPIMGTPDKGGMPSFLAAATSKKSTKQAMIVVEPQG